MSDFVRVNLGDGSVAVFQTVESDLVSERGGRPSVEDVAESSREAGARLEAIADATARVSETLRDRLSPDEVSLEIGVGLSGEVGWFFAKSAMEANLKVTLTWKNSDKPETSETLAV